MSANSKPWDNNKLQNSTHILRHANGVSNPALVTGRNAPVLPPRPFQSPLFSSEYNSGTSPYTGLGCGNYSPYGSSYGMPYRSSMYSMLNSYGSPYGGGYNSYGTYGNSNYSYQPDNEHERRFIQYAEERSKNTFANVESIVRAFNSLAMMLDNTFFAMTSSFRAVLSVAENFGRLRTMFGHIWYSVNIFRFLNWLYRKALKILGYKVPHSMTSVAWNEASSGLNTPGDSSPGSGWPTLAFLGVLMSTPYLISKILPKYEDKGDPTTWKTPGITAKVVFDFVATAPNELSVQINDVILLAPAYIQAQLNLKNTGWVFASYKGKSGVVPLSYLAISKNKVTNPNEPKQEVPIPRAANPKSHTKRVSFGENQIFENVDLDDYMIKKQPSYSSPDTKDKDVDSKPENGILSVNKATKTVKENTVEKETI